MLGAIFCLRTILIFVILHVKHMGNYMRISKKFKFLLAVSVLMVTGVAIWDFLPCFNKQPGIEPFFKGSFYMTPNEIMALHGDLPEEAKNGDFESYELKYKRVMANYPVIITYTFIEYGLVFKQYRLLMVKCEFSTNELSIIECQTLAENLMPLLTPYFEPLKYDYHGRVS